MSGSTVVSYTGSAPGADTDDYVLFDTTTACTGKRQLQGACLSKIVLHIDHVGDDGTLRIEKSDDRGATWIEAGDEGVAGIARTAATAPHTNEYVFEPYDDFRVLWKNGGLAQTTWEVSIALVEERS